MAPDEKMLEELYELLTLYFNFSSGGNLIKSFDKHFDQNPTLDRVIFREALLARITEIIMRR